MADGRGCNCGAWGEHECGCGVDWTQQEVYDLRAALERIDVISLHAVNRMNEVDGMRAIRRECKAALTPSKP